MAPRPKSRIRYRVVGLLLALAFITYLDRACIATLSPQVMTDLKLSKAQMSYVFSAFALAYSLFEIPTAWWADRRGTRRVLTRIVLWWSAFTLLTGAAFGYGQMLLTRFLFGAGEAGAWPSAARTFSRWVPVRERGRVQGIFFACAHLAAGVTPLVAASLVSVMSWRWVFVALGALGIGWSLVWHHGFRDRPEEHPQVTPAEAAEIAQGNAPQARLPETWAAWRKALRHRNLIPLCVSYVPNSCSSYFCITWFPTMLHEKYGFRILSLGLLAGLPLILSVAGDLSGGFVTDRLAKTRGLRVGRVGVGVTGNFLAAAAMGFAAWTHHPYAAALAVALAVAATMFTLAASWSVCADIGGSEVSVVSAAMNTSGQIGAVLCPIAVTALLAHFGDWNAPVAAIGILFFLGALCWLLIDPTQNIFGDGPSAAK